MLIQDFKNDGNVLDAKWDFEPRKISLTVDNGLNLAVEHTVRRKLSATTAMRLAKLPLGVSEAISLISSNPATSNLSSEYIKGPDNKVTSVIEIAESMIEDASLDLSSINKLSEAAIVEYAFSKAESPNRFFVSRRTVPAPFSLICRGNVFFSLKNELVGGIYPGIFEEDEIYDFYLKAVSGDLEWTPACSIVANGHPMYPSKRWDRLISSMAGFVASEEAVDQVIFSELCCCAEGSELVHHGLTEFLVGALQDRNISTLALKVFETAYIVRNICGTQLENNIFKKEFTEGWTILSGASLLAKGVLEKIHHLKGSQKYLAKDDRAFKLKSYGISDDEAALFARWLADKIDMLYRRKYNEMQIMAIEKRIALIVGCIFELYANSSAFVAHKAWSKIIDPMGEGISIKAKSLSRQASS